jgi:hypothetical protein
MESLKALASVHYSAVYAIVHYLYGFDAAQADMRAAANELFQYAEQVEKHVQAGAEQAYCSL